MCEQQRPITAAAAAWVEGGGRKCQSTHTTRPWARWRDDHGEMSVERAGCPRLQEGSRPRRGDETDEGPNATLKWQRGLAMSADVERRSSVRCAEEARRVRMQRRW